MGRFLLGLGVVVASLVAIAVATGGQLATLNHFQCYRVDPGTPWKPVSLVLSDQFGKTKAAVAQLQVLCAPARKNGSVVTNAAAHLTCYPIRSEAFNPRPVIITNQFQQGGKMTVVARTHLCVPAGKSVNATAAPPLVKGLDNYVCYSVKSEQIPTHPISVLDQFGKVGGSALQPLSLCAPAQINNSPLINATTHLVCYGIKLGPTVKKTSVAIHNRFGVANATVFLRQSLCVPSNKKLG